MAGSFVTDRDLYADKDGNVVEADDPAKVTKIASAGSTVADADVEKYGLDRGGGSEGDKSESAPSSDSSPDGKFSEKTPAKKGAKKR